MKVWIVISFDGGTQDSLEVFNSKEKAISQVKKMFKQKTGKEVETLTEIRTTNFQKKEERVFWQTNWDSEANFDANIYEQEVN